MGLLEDINSGKYNLVLFSVIFFLVFYQFWCASSISIFPRQSQGKRTESMAALDINPQIKEAVKQQYIADVEAIRNLSEVAIKLQAGGLTIPGNLTVTGAFNYLPRGSIIAYNQNNAPPGWTLCNGSNGSPDLRGRFILGNGGSRGIGATGGEENVTLGAHQMPQHNHNVNGSTSTNGHHSHGFGVGGGGRNRGGGRGTTEGYTCNGCAFNTATDGAGNHDHTFNVNSSYAGGNQAHNNMPPFYVLTYIMKL